jgi:ATP-binding cassette subfamily F protein 3
MLIGFNNVSFEFGARTIVANATWHIQAGDRVGLVGYNGTGKSTLLKILVGEYQPSAGAVERGKNITIGYLHQDLLSFDTNDSILEVAMSAFERARFLEKEIERIGVELKKKHDEKLLQTYTDYLHEMDLLDGYNIRYKTEEVLHGLGFSTEQFNYSYKIFSGGWRMRVLLAKMILQQPDVLLLDEPTNHLDLPSIEWLEKYLSGYKGSVVIVSHDKFFLNRMVNKIVELYQQQLYIYSGNYDFYETEKAQRIEMQQRAYENQQEYIRRQERFIERFKAKATKAAQAQSAMKRLEKIERIEAAELERPNLRISFQIDKQPGKILVALKNISKSFGKNLIIKNASAEINRGDKIALIGANGKGKSTLLRIIANAENFDGERIWGHNVEESFYAQHQLENLHLDNTILEEMQLCGSGKTDLELRSLLGGFMFGGDDIDKKIKVLSGGEKARVALAKVIASQSNFLLLDEPTNHLDMFSVDLLAQALNKYEGSYILVSHDRYFISKTANKIWEITNYEIKEFKGNYTEYTEWKERLQQQEKEKAETAKTFSTEALQPKTEKPKPANTLDKERKKELQKLQRQLEKTATQIDDFTKEKTAIEQEMSLPETYAVPDKFKELENKYTQLNAKISAAEKEYETLFEAIEKFDK